jgi:hypothetical protein
MILTKWYYTSFTTKNISLRYTWIIWNFFIDTYTPKGGVPPSFWIFLYNLEYLNIYSLVNHKIITVIAKFILKTNRWKLKYSIIPWSAPPTSGVDTALSGQVQQQTLSSTDMDLPIGQGGVAAPATCWSQSPPPCRFKVTGGLTWRLQASQ